MKNKAGLIFLLIALLAGAGAAFTGVTLVRQFNETKSVVVAVRDLAPQQLITKDDVQIVAVPAAYAPKDAVLKPEAAVGRYTRDAIYAGETVRSLRLVTSTGERSLLTAQVSDLKDPSLRAFALPFDSVSAVGGELRQGDRVDIVASVKIDAGNNQTVGVGKVVALNVQVLKVARAANNSGNGSVVVALKPEQIEDIAFALTAGQLRFALNPYVTDVAASQTKGVTGVEWLGKYGFLDRKQPDGTGANPPPGR